jgi:hypothetical protein
MLWFGSSIYPTANRRFYQMSKYRIQVKVELIECNDDSIENDLIELADGSLAMAISEKDAISIDKCEISILQTAYPSIRKAISKHLSDVSKKKHLKEPIQKQTL